MSKRAKNGPNVTNPTKLQLSSQNGLPKMVLSKGAGTVPRYLAQSRFRDLATQHSAWASGGAYQPPTPPGATSPRIIIRMTTQLLCMHTS